MEVIKENVRHAMQALGQGGKEISNHLLYEALGVGVEAEKAVVRSRVNNMIRHGEVERTRPGYMRYNEKYRPREGRTHEAIWRFIRAAKPGWTITECAMMTRVSYTQVLRYCNWLRGEGYIAKLGRDERQAVTYRSTQAAGTHPETPYPPIKEADPFAKERSAAALITRLMLCADPYSRKTAQDICDACQTLLARFGGTAAAPDCVTENENDTEEA